jgi:HIV Tat-specific factor 1
LKHTFTLEELEEDATLLIDLKEDVREEAETLGEVTSITIFDVSPPLLFLAFSAEPVGFHSSRKRRRAS